MSHYVCTGDCKGVTDKPNATCQAQDCNKHAHPLTECNCTDNMHKEAYEKDGEKMPSA